ncbi:hypothetical protein F2P56_012845 [Juglans regia]|uniref:VQ motif-containing protein 4-like n=2 Tax=Juglans regia TaxID=51240 RepID=A0A2I4GKT3_JUGRE|nr:VQ motif-containing protein 4-like [Juglans regia]KAF5468709.1 hypothetical protein F2P56_012845 [Juglans regia]
MENTSKLQERENPSSINSPARNVINDVSNSSSNSNGLQNPTPPLIPKAIPRSDSNPYPTTFVQADTSTFKQVVHMLTGSLETAKPSSKLNQAPSKNHSIPPIRTTQNKQQGFKLYERRNNLKISLMINTFMPNFSHNPENERAASFFHCNGF